MHVAGEKEEPRDLRSALLELLTGRRDSGVDADCRV